MQHNMSTVEETLAWLTKAAEDLESAKILFQSNKATQWHQVLFFCQQAAEKSMKAFLTFNSTKFRWTHDLVEIGTRCSNIDSTLGPPVDSVKSLSDYAWEFRYPGEDPEPTKVEAKSGIECAERFFFEILKRLPTDARPKSITETASKSASGRKKKSNKKSK